MSFEQLKRLASDQGLKYFVAPDDPTLLMTFSGVFGTYQVVMKLELDGRFLQFRTVGYGLCPKSHPHCGAVLEVLGALDYLLRVTKWGWDPNDGEIVACADLWFEDAVVTPEQFQALLGAFLPAIDVGHHRIEVTMQTGIDPGLELPPPIPGGDPGVDRI